MEEQVEKKKRGAQKGRVMTDAQREGLKKGFEALKAKREALKKEKELTKEKPLTNDLPNNNLPVANNVSVNPEPTLIPKKTRVRTPPITKHDLISLKNDILNGIHSNQKEKQPDIVAPVVVASPVAPVVVEPPKVVSGHDLLNRIFFNR